MSTKKPPEFKIGQGAEKTVIVKFSPDPVGHAYPLNALPRLADSSGTLVIAMSGRAHVMDDSFTWSVKCPYDVKTGSAVNLMLHADRGSIKTDSSIVGEVVISGEDDPTQHIVIDVNEYEKQAA